MNIFLVIYKFYLLIDEVALLGILVLGGAVGQTIPVEGSGWPPLGPELVHGEQILDVVVEELLEELLCGVAILLGPLLRRLPLNVSRLGNNNGH